MARDFSAGNTASYISFGVGGDGPDFGTGQLTMLVKVFPDTVSYGAAAQGTLISKDFTNYELIIYQGNVNGYVGGTSNAAPNLAITTGAWAAVGITRTSNIITLKDGAAFNGPANTAAANGNQLTYLGLRPGAAATTAFDGRMAEVALWSVGLLIEEVISFYKGFPAHRIRPQSLVTHMPLIRNDQELRQGATIVVGGSATVVTPHPRRYG